MNSIDSNMLQNDAVLYCGDLPADRLASLLRRYGMQLISVENNTNIPGSYWGDSEAGLIDMRLYVRADTPVHSALHETCHYICMDPQRRRQLDTDAGGGYDEENAVCYLQILLSEHIEGMVYYMTPEEREKIETEVAQAVKKAFELVKSNRDSRQEN